MIIGADSRQEAIEILSSSSDVLKSRGLALHLAKTDIYDAKLAEYHFQIDSNRYLDNIERYFDPSITPPMDIDAEILEKFRIHLQDSKAKYWEKVTKRFVTAFGKLRSPLLLSLLPQLYKDVPGIRSNLLIYLLNLGYSHNTSKVVLDIVRGLAVFDDISLYQVCRLVTDWNVPVLRSANIFLRSFEDVVFKASMVRRQPFDFFCLLWLKAKYDSPDGLWKFIKKYENIWRTSPFLRRQVTAAMARILPVKESKCRQFLESQISTSETPIASLANQIVMFARLPSLESKVRMYLFQDPRPTVYPLHKFIVLCSFLNSHQIREDKGIRSEVSEYLEDAYYLKWVNVQYKIE